MTSKQSVVPTGVVLNREANLLEIRWNDGLVCQYPLPELREACPCVMCRGGHEFMGAAYDPENILVLKPKRSYKATDARGVGNYAIQIFWDDGHQTGIYSWDYLRRLCPPASEEHPTGNS